MGFDDADKSPMEVFARASGERSTIVHTLLGDNTTTITPTAAWITAPPTDKPVALMDITGQELQGVQFDASMFFPGRIKQSLTKLRTGIPQILEDDREVIQVQGNTPSGGTVTLLFDAETGLLVAAGALQRVAGRPHRHADRLPRVPRRRRREDSVRWTVSWLSGRSQFELTDIQPNAQIPAARFVKPALSATTIVN